MPTTAFNVTSATTFFDKRESEIPRLTASSHGDDLDNRDKLSALIYRDYQDWFEEWGLGNSYEGDYVRYLFEESSIFGGYVDGADSLLKCFLSFLFASVRQEDTPRAFRSFYSLSWLTISRLIFAEPSLALLREVNSRGEVRRTGHGIPRDHTVHLGLVYYFGYYILRKFRSVKTRIKERFNQGPLEQALKALAPNFSLRDSDLLTVWRLCSLAHDCSYLMRIESTVLDLRLGHKLHENVCPCYSRQETLREYFDSAWSKLVAKWCPSRSNSLSDLGRTLTAEISQLPAGPPEHGQVAGLMLFEYLADQIDRNNSLPEERALALLAAVAAFRHSTWKDKIESEQGWLEDPLSSFLTTVDEASEWCRVFWQLQNVDHDHSETSESDGWTRMHLYASTLFKQLELSRQNKTWQLTYKYSEVASGDALVDKALDTKKLRHLGRAFTLMRGAPTEVKISRTV